jgi:hypothetical protein
MCNIFRGLVCREKNAEVYKNADRKKKEFCNWCVIVSSLQRTALAICCKADADIAILVTLEIFFYLFSLSFF